MHIEKLNTVIRTFAIVAITLSTMWSIDTHAAKIYKWVDANGKTHYGDNAPSTDSVSEHVTIRKTPAVDPIVNKRNERTKRLLDNFRQEREEKREAKQVAAAQKKKRDEQCKYAKNVQYTYEHSAYLYDIDESGERVILDDTTHAKELAKAQAEVEQWCN